MNKENLTMNDNNLYWEVKIQNVKSRLSSSFEPKLDSSSSTHMLQNKTKRQAKKKLNIDTNTT